MAEAFIAKEKSASSNYRPPLSREKSNNPQRKVKVLDSDGMDIWSLFGRISTTVSSLRNGYTRPYILFSIAYSVSGWT